MDTIDASTLIGSLFLIACVCIMHFLLFWTDATRTIASQDRHNRLVLVAGNSATAAISTSLTDKLVALGFTVLTTGRQQHQQQAAGDKQPEMLDDFEILVARIKRELQVEKRKFHALVVLPTSCESGEALGVSLAPVLELIQGFAPLASQSAGRIVCVHSKPSDFCLAGNKCTQRAPIVAAIAHLAHLTTVSLAKLCAEQLASDAYSARLVTVTRHEPASLCCNASVDASPQQQQQQERFQQQGKQRLDAKTVDAICVTLCLCEPKSLEVR